jgi:hypothetical protein
MSVVFISLCRDVEHVLRLWSSATRTPVFSWTCCPVTSAIALLCSLVPGWFRLVPFGSLWFPLVPFGSLWFPLVPFGSLWFPLVPFGSLWFPLVPFVCNVPYVRTKAETLFFYDVGQV